jgi:thiamine-phosphate pyrophosphorylase
VIVLPRPPLMVITDRRQATGPLETIAAAAISGGARWISVREKDLPASERLALLRRLQALTALTGTLLSVHDDLDAAAELGLRGLHLPAEGDPEAARERLGPAALIGVSAHDIESAVKAARRGADYVTLSPVFLTDSKPGYGPALGLDFLAEACRAVSCPVLGLGGIDKDTIGPVLAAGAVGAALMGGVMRASDPAAMLRPFIQALALPARG